MTQDRTLETPARNTLHWLEFSVFVGLGVLFYASGKALLGGGFLLMGVFALFNNVLGASAPMVGKPSPVRMLSWACGLAGIGLVLAAAVRTFL